MLVRQMSSNICDGFFRAGSHPAVWMVMKQIYLVRGGGGGGGGGGEGGTLCSSDMMAVTVLHARRNLCSLCLHLVKQLPHY